MLFDNRYNNIIDLMTQIDTEVKEVYIKYTNELLVTIQMKCEKCKDFEMNRTNAQYKLTIKNNTLDFIINKKIENETFHINLNQFTEKQINSLNNKENNLLLGKISLKKDHKEIEYYYRLVKNSNDNYSIIMNKNRIENNQTLTIKTIESPITLDKLFIKKR